MATYVAVGRYNPATCRTLYQLSHVLPQVGSHRLFVRGTEYRPTFLTCKIGGTQMEDRPEFELLM